MASQSIKSSDRGSSKTVERASNDIPDLSQSLNQLFVESNSTMAENKSRSSAPASFKPSSRFGNFKAVLSETVVDGEMHVSVASKILAETLEEWQVPSSTDAQINDILNRVAVALRPGTSAERDYSSVFITVGDRHLDLGVLAAKAIANYKGENAVRAWAKSFNGGEMAERTYVILKDPQNVELRSQASTDYSLSLEFVHLAFDYAAALTKCPSVILSQMERVVMRNCTANKTRTSRSAFIGGTDGGSVQQLSDATASGKNASVGSINATKTEASAPGFASRANFANVR